MDENAKREAAENAVKAERQRVADILDVCRKFNVPADKADEYVKDANCNVEKVRNIILEELAEKQKPTTVTRQGSRYEVCPRNHR